MKNILIILAIIFPIFANAGIYTNTNFRPYIGVSGGMNIMDYTMDIDLDDVYYSATINTGARIGSNFGAELFFSQLVPNHILSALTKFITAIFILAIHPFFIKFTLNR